MQIRDLIPWGRDEKNTSSKEVGDENPVSTLQADINRVFENFWQRFDAPIGGTNAQTTTFGPNTDVLETDSEVEVAIELPGLDEKDIQVSLTNETLTIRGEKNAEREEKKKGYYLSERSYGSFYRVVPLPAGVDTEKAAAEFKRGVLKVSIPKSEETKARVKRIEVKGS